MAVIWVLYVGVIVLLVASMWHVFSKAGRPGWASLIPIYNGYVLLKVAGKPGWWIVLYLIPFIDIVIAILVYMELAKRFGKGGGFAAGLILLPFIFWPILGFGDARYAATNNAA
jgi:hypothetical protein